MCTYISHTIINLKDVALFGFSKYMHAQKKQIRDEQDKPGPPQVFTQGQPRLSHGIAP